ncbi:uncharacterized protein FTOL_05386 [Fusarium torulosum]|uniref:Uncharacterized protein n=1 Tax=Fusarium torulosum TaxID=33205 RepID=A0AAE8M7P8_9HYPO|nr:uncharacterized protein FTOL_05386 [Fusarium torulosum]
MVTLWDTSTWMIGQPLQGKADQTVYNINDK